VAHRLRRLPDLSRRSFSASVAPGAVDTVTPFARATSGSSRVLRPLWSSSDASTSDLSRYLARAWWTSRPRCSRFTAEDHTPAALRRRCCIARVPDLPAWRTTRARSRPRAEDRAGRRSDSARACGLPAHHQLRGLGVIRPRRGYPTRRRRLARGYSTRPSASRVLRPSRRRTARCSSTPCILTPGARRSLEDPESIGRTAAPLAPAPARWGAR